MIRSFRSKETEALFLDEDILRFRSIERIARRKLLVLHRAPALGDLRVPPGNRLEGLKVIGRASTVFVSMISGGSALSGLRVMRTMSRSWIIIEVRHGAEKVA